MFIPDNYLSVCIMRIFRQRSEFGRNCVTFGTLLKPYPELGEPCQCSVGNVTRALICTRPYTLPTLPVPHTRPFSYVMLVLFLSE